MAEPPLALPETASDKPQKANGNAFISHKIEDAYSEHKHTTEPNAAPIQKNYIGGTNEHSSDPVPIIDRELEHTLNETSNEHNAYEATTQVSTEPIEQAEQSGLTNVHHTTKVGSFSGENSSGKMDVQSGSTDSGKKCAYAQNSQETTPGNKVLSHEQQTCAAIETRKDSEDAVTPHDSSANDKLPNISRLPSFSTNSDMCSSLLFTQSRESSRSSTRSSSAAGSANASDSSPESSPSPTLAPVKAPEQSLDLDARKILGRPARNNSKSEVLPLKDAQTCGDINVPAFPLDGTTTDDISRGHSQDSLIPIPVVGNRAMLFNLNHIKHLRVHHGIIGLLSGSLPLAPQQNTLLGLPLALSIYEVLHLLFNGVCYLVDGSESERELISEISQDDEKLDEMDQLFADDVVEQRRQRQLQFEEKMKRLGLDSKKHPRRLNSGGSSETIFVKTLDNDSQIGGIYKRTDSYRDNETVQKVLLSRLLKTATNATMSTIYENFRVFNYLKLNFHHTLLPGVRFGGKFVSYPGDPLRYHSHLIVDTRDYYNDDIGMLDITNRGRLATGVKKLWLICGQRRKTSHSVKEKTTELSDPESSQGYRLVSELFGGKEHNPLRDTETVCFSIEWSGFG